MSPEDRAFQDELRAFLKTLPASLTEKVRLARSLDRADYALWHGLLQQRGWFAGPWPREFGGAGWTPMQRHIFDTETALAHAPRVLPFGITMLGPVLQKFGTKAQQDHYLPRILDQTDWWCQGYSEPGAGSDLASLKTRAERVGDEYIVNGQKTWTTLAHQSNWIFCLVRTDPAAARPQEGISFLLIDMASPGVTVRPIVLLDGSSEVNEVFFDDVRVPAGNLVGVENLGWTCAKYLLTHERTGITGIGFAMAALDAVRRMAAAQPTEQGQLAGQPDLCPAPGPDRDRPDGAAHHEPCDAGARGRRAGAGGGKLDAEGQGHAGAAGDQRPDAPRHRPAGHGLSVRGAAGGQ